MTNMRTLEKDHGRLEIRECWTISDPDLLAYLRTSTAWVNLKTVACIRRERRMNDVTTTEYAFYIASLPNAAAVILDATRHH